MNIYCGSYLPDWRPGRDFRETYSIDPAFGGGVHLDLIHELDYCIWLFGKPLRVTSIKRNVSSLHIHSYDFASYHLFYETYTTQITLNYYRRDPKREIEIITDEDTIIVDLLANRVLSKTTRRVLFEKSYHVSETYHAQMKYFIHCLENNLPLMNDFEEAVEILKLGLEESP